jgi:hypothetical protein
VKQGGALRLKLIRRVWWGIADLALAPLIYIEAKERTRLLDERLERSHKKKHPHYP